MNPLLLSQRPLEESLSHNEGREALNTRWGTPISAAGLLPIPVLSSRDLQNYVDCFSPSCVLPTGGSDVSSCLDTPLNRQRDKLERSPLEFAIMEKKPVLGVCRGMRFIAHFFGGRLVPIESHVVMRHVLASSKRGRLRQDLPHDCNSYQATAVIDPGPELKSLATSADGCSEMIDHLMRPIEGDMWHPETELRSINDEMIASFFSGAFETGAV